MTVRRERPKGGLQATLDVDTNRAAILPPTYLSTSERSRRSESSPSPSRSSDRS